MSTPNLKNIYKYMRDFGSHTVTESDKTLIESAFRFAQNAHKDQLRKSGEPYFNHAYAAGENAARFGMDATVIAAAFLHDVIEDTPVTEQEIQKEFGDEIVFLVNGVTKLGRLRYQGRERHVESLRKFFIAVAEDMRVVIIKLVDRLHNIQTLQYVRKDKQKRIALETIEIYAQLAWRLGMARLSNELQDHAFPFAYPKEHAMVEQLLKQRKRVTQKYVEKVYKSLRKELASQNITDITIEYRIKTKYSLYRKLLRKGMDIDKVYDIIALRVIVKNMEDCYRILGLIHRMWKPLPGRIKDYIALPKPNGYQSLHTTIFTGDGGIAEIQIRTEEMHEIAEYGVASHLAYKDTAEGFAKKSLPWLAELKELQTETKGASEFVSNLKTDFFEDRIFVFTPEGDVIDLPDGSSVIDFAYAIHSDIGHHAHGAKVNGKFTALKKVLQNNDIVEVETKDSSHPSSKWLDYSKTTLARKHIQKHVKDNSLFTRFFGK